MKETADANQRLLNSWKVLIAQHPVSGQYYVAGLKLGQ